MNAKLSVVVAVVVVLVLFGAKLVQTIPPGWVGVASLFGEVRDAPYPEGLHFPVNPLYKWMLYDTRQKTYKDSIQVPTRDQLRTSIELSVQWRIIAAMAPRILQETGDQQALSFVHLVPNLRSVARVEGSKVAKAEDFFNDETRHTLEAGIRDALGATLAPKGIEVQAVLIRDVELPPVLARAIEEKKKRQQEVEKQKAELQRYREEQQQQVAAAEAKLQAAEQEAKQIRLLAAAKADEIRLINEAIAQNPAYIKLQSLEALKQIAKDPATKLYFLDANSPQPLPLMHIGDSVQR